ncbi:MAG: hypothetical protein ACNA7M_11510 [Roseovarius sp.]
MNDLSTGFIAPQNYCAAHFADALRLYRHSRRELETYPLAETDEEEAEETLRCDAFCAAEEHLLNTDAPDLAAVIAKLEAAGRDAQPIQPQYVGPIIKDLMRIAGLAESPTFDPFLWINQFERAGGRIMADQYLCAAAGNLWAGRMLAQLKPYERAAIEAYQRSNPQDV